MKKQFIIIGIAVLLVVVGLSGCFEDSMTSKYTYQSEIVIQNSWDESGYLEIIWKEMSGFQFSNYEGILRFGTKNLGNKTSKRTSPEFQFQLSISIYTNQNKDDKIISHESDWTLTSNNNKARYTVIINETGNISVEEQLIS